jgi:hypothetical protein
LHVFIESVETPDTLQSTNNVKMPYIQYYTYTTPPILHHLHQHMNLGLRSNCLTQARSLASSKRRSSPRIWRLGLWSSTVKRLGSSSSLELEAGTLVILVEPKAEPRDAEAVGLLAVLYCIV